MRAACIYSPSGNSVGPFLNAMLNVQEEPQSLHTLLFPADNPIVAVVVASNAKPPVQQASRPDGSFAIVDGEIYNRAELCETLGMLSHTDAELVLTLYFQQGEATFSLLDAAATLLVWDATQEQLFIVRDRWGIIPSFYAEHANQVLWASDIKTLLRLGVSPDINLPALDFFLGNGCIPAPWTFVKHIQKLPAAHVLSLSRGVSGKPQRYWQATGSPKLRLNSAEIVDHLGHLFEQSLRRHYSADAKTAVLLSSGVDSKLIAAGLKTWLDKPIEAFTFRYTNYNGQFNEVDEARKVAEHFGMQHHEIQFRPNDIVDRLEWMLQSYGEPFTYGLHSCILQDVVDAGTSVLMSGAGGGSIYPAQRDFDALRYAQLPGLLQTLGQAALPLLWQLNAQAKPLWLWRTYAAAGDLAYKAEEVMQCVRSGLPANLNGTILPEQYREPFFRDSSWVPEARQAQANLFRPVIQDFVGESAQDKLTFLNRHFWTAEATLYWNHWWGRTYGLSMRFPYFDRDLCDFAMRLPRNSHNKGDFRQLAARLMPQAMAYQSKIYQTVPISDWFQGPLQDFLREHLSPQRIQASGLFNNTVVQHCIDTHISGKNDHGWKLWAILTVLTWQDLVAKRRL